MGALILVIQVAYILSKLWSRRSWKIFSVMPFLGSNHIHDASYCNYLHSPNPYGGYGTPHPICGHTMVIEHQVICMSWCVSPSLHTQFTTPRNDISFLQPSLYPHSGAIYHITPDGSILIDFVFLPGIFLIYGVLSSYL